MLERSGLSLKNCVICSIELLDKRLESSSKYTESNVVEDEVLTTIAGFVVVTSTIHPELQQRSAELAVFSNSGISERFITEFSPAGMGCRAISASSEKNKKRFITVINRQSIQFSAFAS